METWVGGIASYVSALMREQILLGNEVILLCDQENIASPEDILGLRLINYRSSRNPIRIMKIASGIRNVLRTLDADVIHCHSTFPGLYVRLHRYERAKVIYTPHAWAFLKKDVSLVRKFVYGTIERRLANRCTRILCMSFDELRAARRYGLPMSKIDFIYTGIAADYQPPVPAGSLPSPSDSKIRVGYFGRLDYQKGFDIVLDAIPDLKPNLEIHVYGMAVRGGVAPSGGGESKITYHGWLDPASTKSAMREMDVVIVPSRWEGLALVPIEAMRAGKVIVVSGESSLPEQVIHGYNGIILRDLSGRCLAENLNRLTEEECRRMGGNARHVFEQTFRIDRFLKSLMQTYENT
ncbi:glycosyltransferase family 4 protein [Burkholderia sp. A9]|uniref:glycosyltransferase family 4 protein n=1 Tax=Burkholderia sp. A9 TaxID=1365108 RepID=UPI001F282A4A|nr:glycosyltransferase family 4 protein [Burkholderia sp. A9]